MDGGRPECELAVDYKKGAEFKQTNNCEVQHSSSERSLVVSPEDPYMTL